MDMSFQSDSSAKRIAKNGVFTALRFGVYTISGVFFIPFLVEQYGKGPFGLIALAGFLTQYVGLISRCVGNSVARFLNVALNKNDWKQASEIFSTALVASAGLILLQLPLYVVGIFKLHWLIDFPPEIALDFKILVACNVGVFFVYLITGVFLTPIQAANRLDISTTLEAIRLVVRLIVLYILIRSFGAKLWFIGVVDIALSLLHGMAIYVHYRKLAYHLVFKIENISRKWVLPIMKMAGWAIVSALGACLFVKTDVWMINRFVDKEMAGVYAALLVWPNFLKQVSKQLASVLAPVYLIDYAKGDWQRVASLSLSSAKLLGCFVAVAVGVLCVVAKPVLNLWWRGDGGVVQYIPLFRVMMLYLVYTIGTSVLWQIYITLNKVHFTGVVNLLAGATNVLVSMVLIGLGYGAMGVAVGTVFAMVLSSAIAIPWGACREFNVSFKTIWWNYFCATLMLALALAAAFVALFIARFSVVGSAAMLVLLLAGGGTVLMRTILSDAEKTYFINGCRWIFRRLFPRMPLKGGSI